MEWELTKKDQKTISVTEGSGEIDLDYFIGRRGFMNTWKNNDMQVINVQERGANAHSVIIVKNDLLKKGWSIFDPNGKPELPFQIISKDNNVIQNVTQNYLEITGNDALNIGSNSLNPGYCGIFGIIFMIFFKNNSRKENWINNWLFILKCLERRTPKNVTYGVELAAEVQEIISNETLNTAKSISSVELSVLDLIQKYCFSSQSKSPSRSPSRVRSRDRSQVRSRDRSQVRSRDRSRSKRAGKKTRKR